MKQIILFLALLLPSLASAQLSRYNDTALSNAGQPLGGVNVAVCQFTATSSQQPCTPLAQIYQDSAGATPQSNPFQADGGGNFGFWAASANYYMQIYGNGVNTRFYPITVGGSGGGSGSSGNFNRIQPVLGTPLVAGDFAIGVNWGTGATITNITGTDTAFQFTITAGSSPLGNPTVVLTYHDGPWLKITNAFASMTSSPGTADVNTSSTLTQLTMTYQGFPVAGNTYTFSGTVMGNSNVTSVSPSVNPLVINPTASQVLIQPGGTSVTFQGEFDTTGNNSHSGTETFNGPLNMASGGTFTGNVAGNPVFTGADSFKSINNTLYISQFAGSDLGAKMNAAVTFCQATFTACKYILDSTGTISTAPSFPVGSTVECTATAPITLATTWLMNHRSTTYNFNGCQFNYNQDAGSAAFYVGKNLSGVLTCNGTTSATWVSGSQFSTFDVGDQLSIGSGNGFYVAAGSTATTLVLTAACSLGASQTYASTSLGNVFGVTTYPGSVTIRDLNLSYTGAGTQINIGLQYDFVTDPLGENLRIINFTTGSGFYARGMLVGNFNKLILDNDKNAFTLDAGNHSGINITSNDNQFNSCEINNSPAGGKPFYITGASNGNHFLGCDFEGNLATVFGTIDAGAFKNRIEKCDQEINGDGTSGSTDWAVNSADNEFIGNIFVGNTNYPANGIIGNASSANTVLRDNIWFSFGGYATAAASFSGGGYMVAQDNNTGALSFTGFITNEDLGGNYQAVSMQPGAGIGVGALPSAAANAGKMIYVTDSTAIAAEGQVCVGSSTNKALAFSNGTAWKCF